LLDPPLEPVEEDADQPHHDDRAENDQDETQPVVAGEITERVADAFHPRTLHRREDRRPVHRRHHSDQVKSLSLTGGSWSPHEKYWRRDSGASPASPKCH